MLEIITTSAFDKDYKLLKKGDIISSFFKKSLKN